MGDKAGTGKADHEFLVHVQLKIGDLAGYFLRPCKRGMIQQDHLDPAQGRVPNRLKGGQRQIRQHTEGDGLSGIDMFAEGAGH